MPRQPSKILLDLTPVQRCQEVLSQRTAWAETMNGRVGRRVGTGSASLRLTEADVQLLLILIRYRCAVIDDLLLVVDGHIDSVRRRLRRMVAAGLVTTATHGPLARTVYMASQSALRLAGSASREASGSWAQMNHRLRLASWGLLIESHKWTVLTEFEIGTHPDQLLHMRRQPLPRLQGFGDGFAAREMRGQRTHLPDLVVQDPATGEVIAVEVELTRKNFAMLLEIMAAYQRSTHIVDRVVYACAGPTIQGAVQQAANHASLKTLSFGELPCPGWIKP